MANNIRLNGTYLSFTIAVNQLTLASSLTPMELEKDDDGTFIENKKVQMEKIWRIFRDLVLLAAHKLSFGYVGNPITKNRAHLKEIYEVIEKSAATINEKWEGFIELFEKNEDTKALTEIIGSLHAFTMWAEFSTKDRFALKFPAPYDAFNTPRPGRYERFLRWLGHSMTFKNDNEGLHLLGFRVRKIAEAAFVHKPHPFSDPVIEPWIARGDLGLMLDLENGYTLPIGDNEVEADAEYREVLNQIVKRGPKERLTALISWAIRDGYHFDAKAIIDCLERQLQLHPDLMKDPEFSLLAEKFRGNKGLNPFQEEFEAENIQVIVA